MLHSDVMFTSISVHELWCILYTPIVRIPFMSRCTRYIIICDKVCKVGGFLRALRFPPIKLTAKYSWNIVESGVKHHNPNPNWIYLTSILSCVYFILLLLYFKYTMMSPLNLNNLQRERVTKISRKFYFETFFQISKHKTSWIQDRMGSENKYRGEHLNSPP